MPKRAHGGRRHRQNSAATPAGQWRKIARIASKYKCYYAKSWGVQHQLLRVEDSGDLAEPYNVMVMHRGKPKQYVISDYRRPVIKDKYDPSQHTTPQKVLANLRVVQEIAARYEPGDDVVVLDSEAGLTAGYLKAAIAAIPRDNLHVPHPDDGYENAAKELHSLVSWHDATMFEFFRDDLGGEELRAHVWFDYCCTWSGSVEMTLPQVDIEMALHKGAIKRCNGILAITLSLRRTTLAETRRDVTDTLRRLGTTYGYAFREVFTPVVYSTVVLLCYETCDAASA